MNSLIDLITSPDPAIRNQPLDAQVANLSAEGLLAACAELDRFRHASGNLYERVRALLFLHAIHRFHLPARLHSASGLERPAAIPYRGFEQLLHRRFEEAIESFLSEQAAHGPSDAISSALASAYHRRAFQTLADQVRRSVRSVKGNQWMFRLGHPADQPLRLHPLLRQRAADGSYPILRERTPVRMDLTHCGWSDIFFLGMDYPEGAQVLNVSVDLGVHGRDAKTRPPVEAYLRVIDEPVLRLTSVDLGASADLTSLAEVFDFAKDYLGLLKAAVIASGLVPPGVEGSGQSLAELLAQVAGPGRGIEIVSSVNDIPKGSRLAVSTNLLAALISLCMRATGQAASLTGPLQEHERRLVLARAILGEWLGGSGGGWQDSGGVWPGMKLISGMLAAEGDSEFGLSRGRLLPRHRILDQTDVPAAAREALQESLVIVHGGMAQNVGPILEMVTEKYLLRSDVEWRTRQQMLGVLDEILRGLKTGDIRAIGRATTRNFFELIQSIIPWASNLYTETLIAEARRQFGDDFWGFWMLGGMSGGGMGFMVAPHRRAEAQARLQASMSAAKRELEHALPFAMDPVVYDFRINEDGTTADLLEGSAALMPPGYYIITVPALLRQERHALSEVRRAELDKFGAACRQRADLGGMVQALFDVMLPRGHDESATQLTLAALLEENGFDRAQHEQIRTDLRDGRIGLAQNRLRADTRIEDVEPDDVTTVAEIPSEARAIGEQALREGSVAVVTLAAGAGSRWTQGAGVVKALHPFCKFAGRHRTFIETHLAKSRRASRTYGVDVPHVFTTSYLTHAPTAAFLERVRNYGYAGPLQLSRGLAVGLRTIPTERDLRFLWEETAQQQLDEQQQKVRDSLRGALIHWARSTGEATDYTDNVPLQCLHPVGHWFEIPNLLRNGSLASLLARDPQLKYLFLHNIDTVGADLDPLLLGQHIRSGAGLTFEIIARRLEDRGGGLARVNGQVRLIEGLALPREADEFKLSYYNSNSCWIDLDQLLALLNITRDDIVRATHDSTAAATIALSIRAMASRMPTYITLKDVKKRWGHGQEDIFPMAQFEKLWVDMTTVSDLTPRYIVVPRFRGQQLKDQAQLDGWVRDGSAARVEQLCRWEG